jgi:hypothetical protein
MSPDHLSTDQLLALMRQGILGPREHQIRRSVAAGVVWLVFAAILLTLGSLCLYHFGRAGMAVLFGAGMILGGLWNLVWGLIWVSDRSPVLILGADALVRPGDAPERIPWTNIRKATLSRTTRNGVEQSAWVTLILHESLCGRHQIEINLSHLDCDSNATFKVIGARANLQ